MRAMPQVNTMSLKPRKAILLGTSALVCLALSAPVMADDFVITGSNNSTNGTGTKNGETAAAIAAGEDLEALGLSAPADDEPITEDLSIDKLVLKPDADGKAPFVGGFILLGFP